MTIELGQIAATPGALELAAADPALLSRLLARHRSGDWGDLSNNDRKLNDEAARGEDRILSAYETPAGRVWIITEWDRSVTTFLLPEEY